VAEALAVEAVDISKRFGARWALSRLSFTLAKGRSLLLTGHNGSGKTTLLRLIATASFPTAGTLRINGFDCREERDRFRPSVALVSHASFHYEDLSAAQNLQLTARFLGIDSVESTVKELLARWVGGIGEEVESTSLQGDAWHHRSDALTSLAAFVGIAIGLIGGPGYEAADDWAALFACAIIAYNASWLILRAVRDVMDVAPAREFEQRVREIAFAVAGAKGIEKCRIRKSGMVYFVEIHVEVDGDMPVREAHTVGGQVRSALRQSNLRIADVLVHIEPHQGG
jgi:divalent metal cation (Fe/Co/Zn/Cd) transporter